MSPAHNRLILYFLISITVVDILLIPALWRSEQSVVLILNLILLPFVWTLGVALIMTQPSRS